MGCSSPTGDIVCVFEADGLLGPDSGEYVAFSMGCDDYAAAAEGLAVQEEDLCEQELIAGGASTVTCTCRAEPRDCESP